MSRRKCSPGFSLEVSAMASVTPFPPRVSLAVLLAPFLLALPSVAAAAYYSDNRLTVPVHHGGEPVLADDRIGHVRRGDYESYGSYPEHSSYTAHDGGSYLAYILPALAITGLSLLFPNVVTVNTTRRRRRDAQNPAEAESPVNELSEHLMNIYFAATESDECIQRIVCEVGASARSLNSENMTSLISLLSASAPSKYNKFFEKFKMGMNAEKCEKIGCSLLDH
ncbi:uncharacterized protein [Macrobrachium rosenbergii]|uniref:uncharacterized protein isoform X1 n=1 Tax=Macrobrachium rosenbergii TaxID=79674 RepID=UPI0034D6DF60